MNTNRRKFLTALAAVVTVPLAALGFKSQKKWRVVKEQPLSIFEQCAPRIVDVDNSCDGSLTKAKFTPVTPDMFENLSEWSGESRLAWRQTMLKRVSQPNPMLPLAPDI